MTKKPSEQRHFYVALGIPRGSTTDAIQQAYRKVVTRYRRELSSQVEPLDDPTQPPFAFRVMRTYSERRHAILFDEPEPLDSKGQAEVDRFYSGYVPEAIPASSHQVRRTDKDLYVELRLSPQEAKVGGLFPIHIPVVRKCPACHATEETITCSLCQGTRNITEDRMVEVTTPPGVQDGQRARIAMEDVGLDETDLIVLVLVS